MDTDVINGAGPPETATPDEQVWREVMAQLRAFVGRRIADPDRAEDLVAQILLRIHQSLHTVDDRERLTHWVSRVAHNAVIDEYRRAARDANTAPPRRSRTCRTSSPRHRTPPMRRRRCSVSSRRACAHCSAGCRPSSTGRWS